jgi:hypothetical protein
MRFLKTSTVIILAALTMANMCLAQNLPFSLEFGMGRDKVSLLMESQKLESGKTELNEGKLTEYFHVPAGVSYLNEKPVMAGLIYSEPLFRLIKVELLFARPSRKEATSLREKMVRALKDEVFYEEERDGRWVGRQSNGKYQITVDAVSKMTSGGYSCFVVWKLGEATQEQAEGAATDSKYEAFVKIDKSWSLSDVKRALGDGILTMDMSGITVYQWEFTDNKGERHKLLCTFQDGSMTQLMKM